MDLNLPLIAFFTVFVLIFLMRMPIPLGLIAAAIVYFVVDGTNPKMIEQQMMGDLFNNYTLLAVPLFIFAANIMNSGGVTKRVFGFCQGLVGRFQGGLGHVNVLASLVFSGMTGSAMADAAGLGKLEIAAMRDEGYDDGFSCAITAGSAIMGPIFPPSITMVIYSMYSGASVAALFMAGMVPAILISILLMIYVAFISKKRNYPRGGKVVLAEFIVFALKSIPALLTPVILLVGIYTGVMTATEAGAVAAFYALLLAVFGYRELGREAFKALCIDTVKSIGSISIMIGAAGGISYIVAKEHIARDLANWIVGHNLSAPMFLLLVNLVLLMMGMFVDSSIINQVFLPILMPVVMSLGIDLVQFGVMAVVNIMIGLCTPPFGMLLFIVSGVSDTPLKKVIKEMWPILAVMLITLLVITYIPGVTLALPRMLLGYQG